LTKALKAVGSVVAPITLITALMFYFGVQHAHWYFHYFGINHTVMGLTTQDYLLRSADGLFIPLTGIAAAVLILLWIVRLTTGRLPDDKRLAAQRVGAVVAAAFGIVALVVAIIGMVRPEVFDRALAVPGLCLAAGALLLALASNMHWQGRSGERTALPGWVGLTEWGTLFIVVGIGLFWSVTNYSAAVGETRAYRTALELSAEPDAVLYSKDKLSVPGMTAREIECTQPEQSEAAYRYRYEGLKLVLATDNSFFLLPSDWPAGGGIALVLPRTDSVRLEFLRPDLAQGATC
jgi:hypothetical protein